MQHTLILLLMGAVIGLCCWSVTAFALFRGSKKRVLLWEAAVSLALTLIILGLLLSHYGMVTGLMVGRVPSVISFCGTVLTLLTLPRFMHVLVGIPLSRGYRTVFGVVAVSYSTSAWLLFVLPENLLRGPFARQLPPQPLLSFIVVYAGLFYGTLGYSFLLGLRHGQSIGDPVVRKAHQISFGTALPAIVLVALFSLLGKADTATVVLALFFIALALVNLFFSLFFSSQPTLYREGTLTEYFITHYGVSPREKQIIEQVLKGMDNKSIAHTLCISARTVENHLSNIYQKTSVRGRLQLVTLIRLNASS